MAVSDKYIIDVRTKGAKKAGKDLKGIGAGAASMAKSVGIAAVAYVGARGLVSAIQGSIDAFAKQELAQKKLETALGRTSNALLDQARALQQVSMFGDEDIIMMQSMLASFVKGEDQIKKLTVATLDLSAGMGIDLKGAGDLIAKTIGSTTNAMSRYGIEVTGAVGSSERLETLTGNIARLFGGQAKAQAQTMMGSMEQMKNAIGDTAESMGKLLSPAIIIIARGLKGLAESTQSVIDTIDSMVSSTEEFALAESELNKKLEERALLEQNIMIINGAKLELGEKVAQANRDRLDEEIAQLQFTADREKAQEEFKILQLVKNTEFATQIKARYGQEVIGMKAVEVQEVKEMDEEEFRNFEKLQKQRLAVKLRTVSGLAGAISSLAGQHKQGAKVAQRFAQIQATIDTYAAANVALKSYPPPFNYIAMAAVIASGIANVIQIENQKFAQGGLIGGNLHSQGGTNINAERGEFVMSRNAVNSIGVENLNNMNQGSSGGGGMTININGGMISPEFVENELAEAIREASRRGASFTGIS